MVLGRARDLRTALEQADRALEAWIGFERPPADRLIAGSGFAREPPERACPRCGRSVGVAEVVAGGCGGCRGRRSAIQAVVRLGPYEEPLRTWIHRIKYTAWHELGMALGRMLGEEVRRRDVVDPGDASSRASEPAIPGWPRRATMRAVVAGRA